MDVYSGSGIERWELPQLFLNWAVTRFDTLNATLLVQATYSKGRDVRMTLTSNRPNPLKKLLLCVLVG
jgi:hypothetical protein